MSIASGNLNLISDDREDDHREAVRRWDAARREVALENRLAAGTAEIDPGSPHLALAGRVQKRLQGCILPPESRRSLLREAHSLGVREFDAHLVMAVIQDRARRNEPLDDIAGPLEVLARGHARAPRSHATWVLGGAALGLAIGLATLALRWLTN